MNDELSLSLSDEVAARADDAEALPLVEEPAARFASSGPSALSDAELVALALFGRARRRSQLDRCRQLIAEAGSLARLTHWQPADFRRAGLSEGEALRLAPFAEIARRVLLQDSAAAPVLSRAESVSLFLGPLTIGLDVEKFWVLCLSRRYRLIKRVELSSGTATATVAHPREVFRVALREGATALVCAHNHPSGDPTPSAADVQTTRMLREAARLVDIELIDHVIIGRPGHDPRGQGYFSFREAGTI
jgi:DNA repair protein RadC